MSDSEPFLFISHVSEDRVAAMEIVAELERRGIPCWIAPRNIDPGQPFDDAIVSALERCRAMLLVFSDQCNESEYIRREVTVAGETQKVVIPFRIEDAQPRRGLRVRLSDLHWLDGFKARAEAIEELARRFAPGGAAAPHQREQQAAAAPARPSVVQAADTVIAQLLPVPPSTPRAAAAPASPQTPLASGPAPSGPKSYGAVIGAVAVLAIAGVGGGLWLWSGNPNSPARTPIAAPAMPSPPAPSIPFPAGTPTPAGGPAQITASASLLPDAIEAMNKGKAAFERKDYATAVRWEREAADKGNPTAQTYLGYFYEHGLGVMPDYGEALRWYRKAADQGHAPAQKNIGTLYEQGRGVTKDFTEAMRWYRKAADQGHAGAQTNTGYLFEQGLGVPQNYGAALSWYKKAAEQGEAMAQNNIGVFYDKGYGVPQDYGEAVRWYRQAAEQGNVDGEYNLARLYAEGHGLPRDLIQARQWMQKAAEAGDPAAKQWLAAHSE